MRRSIFTSSRPPSPSRSYASSPWRSTSPMTPHHTFSASLMEENIHYAESIITKWDIEASTYSEVDSLFGGDRREAKEFLKLVKELQSAMNFFVSENSSSDKAVCAQKLMQIAMKRLQKEFYLILSASRKFIDAESVCSLLLQKSNPTCVSNFEDNGSDDEIRIAENSISETERVSEVAMADLKAIADCMLLSGYGKECVKIYRIIRKSIVDERLYELGVERLNSSQIQRMEWNVIELKIKIWLNATKIAVKTLFHREKILCDYVFSTSQIIRDSCFAEISRENALTLFEFPKLIAKCKKTPEKMFRTLDLYECISELWPEIESIFSNETTLTVRSKAVNSLVKLGEDVHSMMSDFESAIHKDSSKSPIPGGGVHPLTRYVMNYVIFLSDYSSVVSDIISDWPMSVQSPFLTSDENSTPAVTELFAWLILVLLCKLDGKAELYKDVSLSYLFLANNMNYVVSKVRTSNLKLLLGEDWCIKHETQVSQYAVNYERMGWNKVISSLPENPTAEISPEAAKECFKGFNSAFEEAYRKQSGWVVYDPKLRDEIKVSVAKKVVPLYRAFYEKHQSLFRREPGVDSLVRFAPDDLGNHLSDLFDGTGVLGSMSLCSASPSRERENFAGLCIRKMEIKIKEHM